MNKIRTSVAALAATLALTGALGAQTPTYSVEFVGSAPAGWSSTTSVIALNDQGLVVGNTTVELIARPWIGRAGEGLQLLPLPPDTQYAKAEDVNEAGLVVGWLAVEGQATQAAVWQPVAGGYEVLLLPAGPDGVLPSFARGVNDRGDVVGKYGVFSGSFVWNAATGVTPLPGFPGEPVKINNQRQAVSSAYRVDLDTMLEEQLVPTGTGFNYMFSTLWVINDIGEVGGYGNTATGSSWSKQAIRYTDGAGWKLFNVTPLISANVMGIAASGDTAFQLGTYGLHLWVEGHGSIPLQDLIDPAFAQWDLSDSWAPMISRAGRLSTNAVDTAGGQYGFVVLTPRGFDDLGGGSMGALGAPVLGGYGSLEAGAPTRLRLSAAAPGELAYLLLSTSSTPAPFHLGTLHANPVAFLVGLPTDALGRIDMTFAWPATPAGTELFMQYGVVDSEAPSGVALSNALRGVTR